VPGPGVTKSININKIILLFLVAELSRSVYLFAFENLGAPLDFHLEDE
jgi:hypothetical protein